MWIWVSKEENKQTTPQKEAGSGWLRKVLPSRQEVCWEPALTSLNGSLSAGISVSTRDRCSSPFADLRVSRFSEVTGWAALSCLPLLTVHLLCRNKQWPKIAAQQNQRGIRQQVTCGNCTNLSPQDISANVSCATVEIEANVLFRSCLSKRSQKQSQLGLASFLGPLAKRRCRCLLLHPPGLLSPQSWREGDQAVPCRLAAQSHSCPLVS